MEGARACGRRGAGRPARPTRLLLLTGVARCCCALLLLLADAARAARQATGHGFSAAAGKAGAIIGAFGFLYASQPAKNEVAWKFPCVNSPLFEYISFATGNNQFIVTNVAAYTAAASAYVVGSPATANAANAGWAKQATNALTGATVQITSYFQARARAPPPPPAVRRAACAGAACPAPVPLTLGSPSLYSTLVQNIAVPGTVLQPTSAGTLVQAPTSLKARAAPGARSPAPV